MTKVLKLKFFLEPKGSFTLNVEYPKENLQPAEVEKLMEMIVAKQVFTPRMGIIKEINSAEVIETVATTII
ncbi:MAG: DUF2922 domain-containing protein [Kurthia sp.]|nr:DUF2922 domain-containing protein [Candidatus Kurthia equi]